MSEQQKYFCSDCMFYNALYTISENKLTLLDEKCGVCKKQREFDKKFKSANTPICELFENRTEYETDNLMPKLNDTIKNLNYLVWMLKNRL